MKIGSQEHRDAFCTRFTQTYIEYNPKTLPWPVLDAEALHRLQSVPFWEEVFYTERRAGAIVAAFTETVSDPVLKAALALQGQEETRHANLIRVMIDRYDLTSAVIFSGRRRLVEALDAERGPQHVVAMPDARDRPDTRPLGAPPLIARDDQQDRQLDQPHASHEAECQTVARWADGAAMDGCRRARSRERISSSPPFALAISSSVSPCQWRTSRRMSPSRSRSCFSKIAGIDVRAP